MPQVSDVVIAGDGYMVSGDKGSYKRMSDGEPEGRTGRVVIKDFFGGQRQPYQFVRDRAWDSEGVGPAYMGQGVEPWPYLTAHADGVVPVSDIAERMPTVVQGGYVWLGYGRYLYKSIAITASSWASFQLDEDFGGGSVIKSMATWSDDDIAVAFGATKDIQTFDCSASTTAAVRAGRKADCIVGYNGMLVWGGQEGSKIRIDDGTNQDSRDLDARPVQMALHEGRVAIATRSGSVYLLGGRWDTVATAWVGEPEPLVTMGTYADDQDFKFLLSFGGRLYTWLMGEVLEYNPSAGASRQGWRSIGLQARSCYGGAVAGNMLIVTVIGRSGNSEVWAWDGSGWWLANSITGTAGARCWPAYLGGCANFDLLAFRDGASYDLYRMAYRSSTYNNYRADGAWTSSMLDAGEIDKRKAWMQVGASFAAPEIRGDSGSSDSVTISLEYSTNGGQSWTLAQSLATSSPATLAAALIANLSGVEARYIQLRVSWSSVSDWCPTLAGVWAEYELLGAPAKRRRWQIKVSPRDKQVQRDASIDSRSGRDQISALWGAWEAGSTVTYRDLDYDATPTQYNVRIIGIVETVDKPADQGRWGDSSVALTLLQI